LKHLPALVAGSLGSWKLEVGSGKWEVGSGKLYSSKFIVHSLGTYFMPQRGNLFVEK